MSQTAGTSMLENIIHSVSDEYIGTFFPDLLAGSSSAEALSQGVQWMVFVGGEIGAPSNSFAPLVSVPVPGQSKADASSASNEESAGGSMFRSG